MKKSMRKADARLAEARKYVSKCVSKYESISKPLTIHKTNPTPTPVIEPVRMSMMEDGEMVRVDSAEIKKRGKGNFFVVVTYYGQKHEIEKRFKSTTKAQEWIANHEYMKL